MPIFDTFGDRNMRLGELARELGVSLRTVQKLVDLGIIPVVTLPGARQRRIDPRRLKEIRETVNAHGYGRTTAAARGA